MKEVLVDAKNLKKYFPTGDKDKPVKAVDDVSFQIFRGETLGVVGESGCGKSTTGRLVLNLIEPTSGSVTFQGTELTTLSRKDMRAIRSQMQIIFQDPYASLDPRKTVYQILAEPFQIHHPEMSREQIFTEVSQLVYRVGLRPEHVYRYPHEFSGGQRQRVGIARAIALHPQFVVCDEPVSALDVSIQAQVINMFDELQDQMGLTYLFIAHDLLVVRHISDRIAVMYLGKMVELADAKEIYDHPLHPYTKCLMSAVPLPDPKAARENKRIVLTGDIPSPLNAPSGCPFRTRCPYAKEECAASMPEFKEVQSGHFVACHRLNEIG